MVAAGIGWSPAGPPLPSAKDRNGPGGWKGGSGLRALPTGAAWRAGPHRAVRGPGSGVARPSRPPTACQALRVRTPPKRRTAITECRAGRVATVAKHGLRPCDFALRVCGKSRPTAGREGFPFFARPLSVGRVHHPLCAAPFPSLRASSTAPSSISDGQSIRGLPTAQGVRAVHHGRRDGRLIGSPSLLQARAEDTAAAAAAAA
jgi:hypothetical protein